MMLEDRYLVWKLKRGSTQALCRIYSRYETDLLTLATSLLGRTGYAEDVLQDVFVKFLESIDAFELTGSLKGYLATCVANRARDYLRRDRGRAGEATADFGLRITDYGVCRIRLRPRSSRSSDSGSSPLWLSYPMSSGRPSSFICKLA